MRTRTLHFLQLGIAWLLLLVGVVFFISPIPIGIFFIALGLTLLIYTSDAVVHRIRDFRDRHEKLNTQLIWVEDKLHNRINFVSVAIRRTQP